MFAVQFSKDHNDYITNDDQNLAEIKTATTDVMALSLVKLTQFLQLFSLLNTHLQYSRISSQDLNHLRLIPHYQ